MDQCYARSLPIDAMRTMAGFHPVHRNYNIPRDVEVPELLQRKVFPGIDSILKEEEAKPRDTTRESTIDCGLVY